MIYFRYNILTPVIDNSVLHSGLDLQEPPTSKLLIECVKVATSDLSG